MGRYELNKHEVLGLVVASCTGAPRPADPESAGNDMAGHFVPKFKVAHVPDAPEPLMPCSTMPSERCSLVSRRHHLRHAHHFQGDEKRINARIRKRRERANRQEQQHPPPTAEASTDLGAEASDQEDLQALYTTPYYCPHGSTPGDPAKEGTHSTPRRRKTSTPWTLDAALEEIHRLRAANEAFQSQPAERQQKLQALELERSRACEAEAAACQRAAARQQKEREAKAAAKASDKIASTANKAAQKLQKAMSRMAEENAQLKKKNALLTGHLNHAHRDAGEQARELEKKCSSKEKECTRLRSEHEEALALVERLSRGGRAEAVAAREEAEARAAKLDQQRKDAQAEAKGLSTQLGLTQKTADGLELQKQALERELAEERSLREQVEAQEAEEMDEAEEEEEDSDDSDDEYVPPGA